MPSQMKSDELDGGSGCSFLRLMKFVCFAFRGFQLLLTGCLVFPVSEHGCCSFLSIISSMKRYCIILRSALQKATFYFSYRWCWFVFFFFPVFVPVSCDVFCLPVIVNCPRCSFGFNNDHFHDNS